MDGLGEEHSSGVGNHHGQDRRSEGRFRGNYPVIPGERGEPKNCVPRRFGQDGGAHEQSRAGTLKIK